MNDLYLGGAGVIGIVLFFLYRWGFGKIVEGTIEHTEKEDKSLQQQQLENQQKLAKVNKELAGLYAERQKVKEELTDQEKADQWNKPPEQH